MPGNEIAAALAAEQFALRYQPQLDLVASRVVACEALIRWEHPTRGTLLPAVFLPCAARSGMLRAIDAWVLHTAFGVAAELRALAPEIRLDINLSRDQLGEPELIRAFTDAAAVGVNVASLGVDIDADDALRNPVTTRRTCHQLRRLGVHVAIDDLSGGTAALSALAGWPIDAVKVHRKAITLASQPSDSELTAELIDAFAAESGITSVVEGIERHAHVQWVRETSIRVVQGFALCRPLPLDEFKRWLVTAQAMGSRAPENGA
jgi:EAL domain-containing protein (putative c-di-GMP-specific phosphodiesterase class I)